MFKKFILIILFIFAAFCGCQKEEKEIERPEQILSKRNVFYKKDTYQKLEELWKNYNEQFPSEDAYANWMYAARYADNPDYKTLLMDGLKKYPANPKLLYLAGMLKHGAVDNLEGLHYLEKAVKLDPSFTEPWFSLVINYMERGEIEKFNLSLRKILESGAIQDEVIDFNYNMLSLLKQNAVLITNGDNDTYPGWILTQIIKYRSDVKIVNRNLLNAEWYPLFVINNGVPNFITKSGLDKMREDIEAKLKAKEMNMPAAGPFSDTLIVRLIDACKRDNTPVYIASTIFETKTVTKYMKQGYNLGLVTLVFPLDQSYPSVLKNAIDLWLDEFRTGSLHSWELKYSKESNAAKMLMYNYPSALYSLLDDVNKYIPDYRIRLFKWYQQNIMNVVDAKKLDDLNKKWCSFRDIKEIDEWCKKKDYIK